MHTPGHFRPVVLSPNSDGLDAARVAAVAAAAATNANPTSVNSNVSGYSGLNSSFTGFALPNTTVYPEIALFSQFGQLFPQYTDLGQNQAQPQAQQPHSQPAPPQQSPSHLQFLQQPQSVQPLQHKPTLSGLSGLSGLTDDNRAGGSRGKTRSSDSRSSSAYASRHQAAEQRRRTRINERLELLRRMVPHAERANTACFLEEVIKYIDTLKRRNTELEAALKHPSQPHEGGKPTADSAEQPQASPAGGWTGPASAREGEGTGDGVEVPSVPSPKPTQPAMEDVADATAAADSAGRVGGRADPTTATIQSLLEGYTGMPPPQQQGPPRKASSQSPASSEESGVPFKKRKMLVL